MECIQQTHNISCLLLLLYSGEKVAVHLAHNNPLCHPILWNGTSGSDHYFNSDYFALQSLHILSPLLKFS
ncbi:unnamed protein product, partial [Mesorhabditis belari]|uniref:Uncharacterized protein n=1 Tax=Mesorhabditis belari TaxID=2138241 RepID=A0AAF3FBW7_9BILA